MTIGRLIQVDPEGPTFTFDLNPTTMRFDGRQARLDTIDTARHVAGTEWTGRTPRIVEFTLRLDGYPDTSVSDRILQLQAMAGMHHPDREPPKVRLDYGGVHATTFVIAGLDRSAELRRADLQVVRIDMDVRLREWRAPDVVESPAVRASRRTDDDTPTATSGKTHTVTAGDTLWALADRHLGAGSRWREIADANDVRDPRQLQIGATLTIPDR